MVEKTTVCENESVSVSLVIFKLNVSMRGFVDRGRYKDARAADDDKTGAILLLAISLTRRSVKEINEETSETKRENCS